MELGNLLKYIKLFCRKLLLRAVSQARWVSLEQ
jgi:hypothetical protein